jgi:hypothetical protein
MYEWLEKEISAIKTRGFHQVDGPADSKLREAVLQSTLSLPESYRAFVLKFGNAKLYRTADHAYLLGVFAGPRSKALRGGSAIYEIGFHDGAKVCVRPAVNSRGFQLLEIEASSKSLISEDFEEWLERSSDSARRSYGTEKWQEILLGPAPFTAEEEEVIEARRQIRWRVVGTDPSGDKVFEVTNGGNRTIPVLTVGLRSRNGRLNGEVRLKIGHVRPGHTAQLHASCYKDLMSPDEIEAFALPDPTPEDRDYYGEFGI